MTQNKTTPPTPGQMSHIGDHRRSKSGEKQLLFAQKFDARPASTGQRLPLKPHTASLGQKEQIRGSRSDTRAQSNGSHPVHALPAYQSSYTPYSWRNTKRVRQEHSDA